MSTEQTEPPESSNDSDKLIYLQEPTIETLPGVYLIPDCRTFIKIQLLTDVYLSFGLYDNQPGEPEWVLDVVKQTPGTRDTLKTSSNISVYLHKEKHLFSVDRLLIRRTPSARHTLVNNFTEKEATDVLEFQHGLTGKLMFKIHGEILISLAKIDTLLKLNQNGVKNWAAAVGFNSEIIEIVPWTPEEIQKLKEEDPYYVKFIPDNN